MATDLTDGDFEGASVRSLRRLRRTTWGNELAVTCTCSWSGSAWLLRGRRLRLGTNRGCPRLRIALMRSSRLAIFLVVGLAVTLSCNALLGNDDAVFAPGAAIFAPDDAQDGRLPPGMGQDGG